MDTILYIYKKRGLTEPQVEPVGMKSYLLIRIALNVEAEEWFGIKLDWRPPELSKPATVIESPSSVRSGSRFSGWIGRHWERRREDARRRQEEQEMRRLSAEREERISRVSISVERLADVVREMAEDPRTCFCVYEDSVRRSLMGETPILRKPVFEEATETGRMQKQELVSLWQNRFPWEEFQGYLREFWVEKLFSEAIHPHFVILGTAPCLFSLLEKHARRMRSVRWLIPEREFHQEISEFVEDFYTEYGLAIGLEVVKNVASFRRVQAYGDMPANILDFTGETCVALPEVTRGSVWLDMLSVEEKRRRIAVRGVGITYVSLKERWRRAQKRCSRPIFS